LEKPKTIGGLELVWDLSTGDWPHSAHT